MKKKVDKKDNINFSSRAYIISEIAIRNELPISKVKEVYNGFDAKFYPMDLRNIGKPRHNPVLDEKIFRLTERYIDIERIKELNKLR